MALVEEKLKISAESDVSALQSGLSDASQSMDSLGDSINQVASDSNAASQQSDGLGGSLDILSGIGMAATGVMAGLGLAIAGVTTAGALLVGGLLDQQESLGLLQAQTGATNAEIVALGESGENVFAAGWGESLSEVYTAMGQVQTITGAAGDELEGLTTGALMLSEVFDKDIDESTRAIDTLMNQFGLTSTEALDLVTAGLQQTGDPAGDLLDTLNEYSGNFAEIGLTGEQALNLINQTLEAGARNTDDAADALREFQIRLKDGSSAQAIKTLGADSQAIFDAYTNGEVNAAAVLETLLYDLTQMEDATARNAAGVAIFGTKWEDMGEQALLAMDPTSNSLGEIEGAAERAGNAVQGQLGDAWEQLTRTVQVSLMDALEPFAAQLLEDLIPALQQASEWFISDGIPAIQSFTDGVMSAFGVLQSAFNNEGWQGVAETVLGALATGFNNLNTWIFENLITPMAQELTSTSNWEAAGAWLLSVLDGGLASISEGVSGWLTTNVTTPLVTTLTDPAFFENAGTWLGELLKSGVEGVGDLATWANDNILQPILGVFSGGEGGENAAEGGNWLQNLLQSGIDAIGDISLWTLEHLIIPFGNAITDPALWTTVTQGVSDFFNGFFTGLGVTPGDATAFIKTSIIDPVKTAVNNAIDDIYNTFAKMFNDAIPDELSLQIPELNLGFGVTVGGGTFGVGPIPDPLPMRRLGGLVSSGQPYLVGEAGPEIAIFGAAGRVYNADQSAAMMGGNGQLHATIILPDVGVLYQGMVAYGRGQ